MEVPINVTVYNRPITSLCNLHIKFPFIMIHETIPNAGVIAADCFHIHTQLSDADAGKHETSSQLWDIYYAIYIKVSLSHCFCALNLQLDCCCYFHNRHRQSKRTTRRRKYIENSERSKKQKFTRGNVCWAYVLALKIMEIRKERK